MMISTKDTWVDYLAANGYDVEAIYNAISSQPQARCKYLLRRVNTLLSVNPQVRAYFTKMPLYKHPAAV